MEANPFEAVSEIASVAVEGFGFATESATAFFTILAMADCNESVRFT